MEKIKLTIKNEEQSERVVFLNPLGTNREFWAAIAMMLNDFETVFVDYSGYFESDYYAFDSVAEIATCVEEQLEYLSPKPTHLIGASLGSWVAQRMCLAMTETVSSLTLISPSKRLYKHGQNILANWMELYQVGQVDTVLRQFAFWSFYTKSFELIHNLTENYVQKTKGFFVHSQVLYDQMRIARAYDTAVDLEQIKVPTLILRGDSDSFYPKSCSEDLHREIANSTFLEVPESGHACVSENPMFIAKKTYGFLLKQKQTIAQPTLT